MSALSSYLSSTDFLEAQKAYQRGELSLEELKAAILEAFELAPDSDARRQGTDHLMKRARIVRETLIELGSVDAADVVESLMRGYEAMMAAR